MFVDRVLESLRDDKNSIERLIELFQSLNDIPKILKNQETIIELLKRNSGMSPEFRALLLSGIEKLNKLGEDNNSKGKEETQNK